MKRVTLPQFRTVKSAVDSYCQSSDDDISESKGFLYVILAVYLGLDDYDASDAIIDGSYDGGIDAIYIDENNNKRPKVYLFQSKYYQNPEKFDRHFEGGALTKMKEAFNDFVIKGRRDEQYQNTALQDKLNDISQLENPEYHIVFCSNSDHPSSRAKEQFEQYIDDLNETGDFYSVEYLHLFEIAKLLAPIQRNKIDLTLKFIGRFIDYQGGDARMFLGQVNASEIAKAREEKGDALFDKNVRGYLSRRNEINSKIQETASGEESQYFMYLNNGLTISCDDITHNNPHESPVVEIANAQIVNGGQTTNSIHEAYKKKTLKDNTTVLVRVLQIKKKGLLPKIILSTNNQTKVTSRDLRSNDDIQRYLTKEIEGYGYWYESRKDRYKATKPSALRVDALKAAQAYYAVIQKNPADAKNKKAKLFSDLYELIFNDYTKGEDLLFSYLLHERIRKLNKQYKEKHTFVNDASLHIASILYANGVTERDHLEKPSFTKHYEDVLKAVDEVVRERINELGDRYSHRVTFIDSYTIGRIEEAYKDMYRGK